MRIYIIALVLIGSTCAFAENYDCGDRDQISVNTSFFSNRVKKVDGVKINQFSEFVSAKTEYSSEKEIFKKYHDDALVESAYKETYRVIGDRNERAYSSGFFELKDKAYVIWISRPSPWCIWDACSTHYEIISCNKINQ